MENNITTALYKSGIVPVVKAQSPEQAVKLAKALAQGGIYCMEITFRTDAAADAIATVRAELPDILVGAGTVLSKEQAKQAAEAGAQFIVTPGFSEELILLCKELNIPIYPGCCTPAEVSRAVALGVNELKFFPARASGGVSMLKSLQGPFPKVKFIPTGGITPENMLEYLACDNVLAVGGSWMVGGELAEKENWTEITELSRRAVDLMLGYKFKHMGINCGSVAEAQGVSDMFARLLDWSLNENPKSIFAGDAFEVTKAPFFGKMGHICIGTNNLDRACDRFSRRGFEIDESTAQYSSEGKLLVTYLKGEFGGFALHFLPN